MDDMCIIDWLVDDGQGVGGSVSVEKGLREAVKRLSGRERAKCALRPLDVELRLEAPHSPRPWDSMGGHAVRSRDRGSLTRPDSPDPTPPLRGGDDPAIKMCVQCASNISVDGPLKATGGHWTRPSGDSEFSRDEGFRADSEASSQLAPYATSCLIPSSRGPKNPPPRRVELLPPVSPPTPSASRHANATFFPEQAQVPGGTSRACLGARAGEAASASKRTPARPCSDEHGIGLASVHQIELVRLRRYICAIDGRPFVGSRCCSRGYAPVSTLLPPCCFSGRTYL
ncbi:hypothetical protein BV25DRAFT_983730 [Artomyces pyxidatus]|uniref:Uncharacterized protein n=1 Tax=Artomyces pyxidatus TaxID=48021 RepID=A0ACB8SVB1_9AGAM|nr:hypothetical protein BV25DRAFT_983730 [Artomyces pyxidatus]